MSTIDSMAPTCAACNYPYDHRCNDCYQVLTHDLLELLTFTKHVCSRLNVCECKVCAFGYGKDIMRNMWVCGQCFKPNKHNPGYNLECDNCLRPYTVRVYPDDMLLCSDCE